jgi:hypothetical protein
MPPAASCGTAWMLVLPECPLVPPHLHSAVLTVVDGTRLTQLAGRSPTSSRCAGSTPRAFW